MKILRKVELDGRYGHGKNVGQSHRDERANLCGHYCRKCLKSRGNHALRCGAEFPVNFRATVLSVIPSVCWQ